jgi:hypothetical protein
MLISAKVRVGANSAQARAGCQVRGFVYQRLIDWHEPYKRHRIELSCRCLGVEYALCLPRYRLRHLDCKDVGSREDASTSAISLLMCHKCGYIYWFEVRLSIG